MAVTAEQIRQLREKTGAGVMDCKKALAETGADIERAIKYLRERGLAKMQGRAARVASEGVVESYVHLGGKIGVLVEVNSETDFVARTEDFRALAKELTLQVAALKPLYVAPEDVPEAVLENERAKYRQQALGEGKPENVVDRIVEGRLKKFYGEACLLEQAYIRDPERTVRDLVAEVSARTGEKIQVRRFARFEVGEGIERPDECEL